MSCRDCVFRSEYRDMGASADVCTLHDNLASAIHACDHSEDCKYRFTISEARIIVLERVGGLPQDKPTAADRRESSGDPEKDFSDALLSIREGMNRFAKALADEMKSFEKALAEREGKG